MAVQLDGHRYKMTRKVSVLPEKGHQMVAVLAFSPQKKLKTRMATREA